MKPIQYWLELVWTNLDRKLMLQSTSPFMAISMNDTITLPREGERVRITSLRHFIAEHDAEIIHHILLHVEDVVTTD